ncbi:MAG TPA: VOC family protein [Gammaproteobacteria bacterium]|jgi:methylmalonyl-CoA/ethylmalonyl-CoA epimerase
MRGLALFLAGVAAGGAIQMAAAQSQNRGLVGLNHVGLTVPDMDAAVAYYTETLGFPEAFRAVDDAGEPTLVYVQISRDTFVELNRANGRPAGINHLGIHVEDVEAAAAMFRERGAEVTPVRSGSTRALLSDVTDLNGIRIELAELTPESLHRRAMDNWQ